MDGLVGGAVTMAGAAVGGAITCYALDGIASLFFPPAAALAGTALQLVGALRRDQLY